MPTRMITLLVLMGCPATTTKTDVTDTTDTLDTTDTTDTTDKTDPTGTTGDTGTEVMIAKADNDTIDAPLFEETFLGSGAPTTYTFDDDISAAPGDTEDWVAFTTPAPDNPNVQMNFELVCTGTDSVSMQLWDVQGAGSTDLGASFQVNCAVSKDSFLLELSHDYVARIHYPSGSKAGDYTAWELTISR